MATENMDDDLDGKVFGSESKSLRPATIADIAAMHAVRMAVRENQLSDPSRVTVDDYRRLIEADGRGWVFERDGELVAFGIVDLSTRSIWALFVSPHAEGRGIGSALLNRMVACAFGAGSAPIHLTTSPGTRAERFYRKAGWQEAGRAADGELRFELPAASG